jgi:rhodanese-related sulfurtransferase
MTRLFSTVALVGTLFGILACRDHGSLEWGTVKTSIRSDYPTVRHVSTDELAYWLQQDDPVVLIDARKHEEYAVSHITGAKRASNVEEALAALEGITLNSPVVVYCSVGYRSSALVGDIEGLGFTKVFNLEGSIFQWANEGRPVYRDGMKVEVVHPYDSKWGKLLNRVFWWNSSEGSLD